MASAATWVAGARPRTLAAAVVPVAVGSGVAASTDELIWWRTLVAGVVAVAIQVGTNYANDYSDGVRGTDDVRHGPVRLVGQRLATPGAVRAAALAAFGVAAVAGLTLAAAAGWWLVALGAVSILAGWLYTGGPAPYGYLGLGEVMVFAFFGVVATAGTAYVSLERVTGPALVASVPVGLLAVALLVANNLRDIPGDAAAGKRTLAVRLGDGATRRLYVGVVAAALVSGAALAPAAPWALLVVLAVPVALPPVRTVLGGASGRDLVPVLAGTGRLQLATGLLLTIGLAAAGGA